MISSDTINHVFFSCSIAKQCSSLAQAHLAYIPFKQLKQLRNSGTAKGEGPPEAEIQRRGKNEGGKGDIRHLTTSQ